MASIESTPELHLRRFLTFGVAGRLCACDLAAVREIVTARAATRLPGAPDWVRGLINLRGSLVTVVDLAVRFGTAGDGAASRSCIVADVSGRTLGIEVTEVHGVQGIAEDALEAVDAQRAAGGLVCALATVGGVGAASALVVDIAEVARQALVL